MKIYDQIEQGTPEWFAIRKGKMTASHATAIGNYGKGLQTYTRKLMAEFFSSGEKVYISNRDTERGVELEPLAREMYIMETGYKIREVGFIEHNEYVGCSPDGLIDENEQEQTIKDKKEGDGGLEIKCVNDENHFDMVLEGESKIESGYMWQMQQNMHITGRKWWDYVSYNPNFEVSLVIIRVKADPEKHLALTQGYAHGQAMIEKLKKDYEAKKKPITNQS